MESSACDWALNGGYGGNAAGMHASRETLVTHTHQCNSRQVAVCAHQLGSYQVCLAGHPSYTYAACSLFLL